MSKARLTIAFAILLCSLGALSASTRDVPLNDLGTGLYLNRYQGGLYPGGANMMPADHRAAGQVAAAAVQPIGGKIVLLSIGLSNTSYEWCGLQHHDDLAPAPCTPASFMAKAARDPRINPNLTIVNGALGGEDTLMWDSAAESSYDWVRDIALSQAGVSEWQVQAVWVKLANKYPSPSLPGSSADAVALSSDLADVVRALAIRYPNLRQVFLSSRIYAGYATTALNPEPYAYESGFSVKKLIESQITQDRTGVPDATYGDLRSAFTPWIDWGPYLWADGGNARSDGLTWVKSDFRADGVHPSEQGVGKVGDLLLRFFVTSPLTRTWFLAP